MKSSENLVWIDCEMTGLDVEKDCLVEIAVLVTDSELNILDDGLSVVIKPREDSLAGMGEFVTNMHKESGLLELLPEGLNLEEAEAQYKQQLAEGKFIDDQEKAQLKYAELEFKTLQLEYQRSQQNADRMLAKANIAGMTVMQNIFRGSEFAQIQQGDQIYPGQFFMQVVDPNSMIINATVNQVDGEQLRIGMKARVRFDAYPGLEVPAHIVSIAAVPKSGGMRASFVREIPVRLKIDQMDKRIIPDLSCSVDVVMLEEKDAVVAPLAGVFADEESGKRVVYIKNGEAWNRREVEVSLENYLVAAVKGLNKGDVIALDKPPTASLVASKG